VSATRFVSLSFGNRLTLVAAAAVAVAVICPGLVVYYEIETFVSGQIDAQLQAQARQVEVRPPQWSPLAVTLDTLPGQPSPPYLQFVAGNGQHQLLSGPALPVTREDVRVAQGKAPATIRTVWVHGQHLRVLTERVDRAGPGLAVQIPSTEQETLDKILVFLRLLLVVVAACGIAVALLMGRLVAQAALVPVQRLRVAIERVERTGDMSQRVPADGSDELSRLAAHFNRMLAALDRSLRSQRQLVADASHELRTPLTSLRTNVEVLKRSPGLGAEERARLLQDVLVQVEQLTRLVQDLIDLARGEAVPMALEEVRIDEVVAAAVERAARHWPDLHFRADLEESVVVGDEGRLERAISNLLDNAGKWSPPGGVVEIAVSDHELTVRDHGPGIDPADLPHVFDRFWRAPAARGMPGSGLGLAIVRQVVEAHDASVEAELPPDGGTRMRIRFLHRRPSGPAHNS
jgi:two-component system sensor histidine kinase MprB